MSKPNQDTFDIAVVGGGLTGGVLAISLADVGLPMVLCERGSFINANDKRVIALSYGGANILMELGLWQEINTPFPINSLAITIVGQSLTIRAEDLGLPVLGYTIPYVELQRVIAARLQDLSTSHRLSINDSFEVTSLSSNSSHAIISNGVENINSRLILCAEGSQSLLAKHMQLGYHHYAAEEYVWVMKVNFNERQSQQGYFFSDDGGAVLALIPYEDSWTAVLTMAADKQMVNDATIEEMLKALTQGSIHSIDGAIKMFPIHTYLAKERVKGRVVFLGNTAYSVPPLGGQNYNLTLFTIKALHHTMMEHLGQGSNIHNRSFLEEFIQRTEKEVTRRITMVHHLNSLLHTKPLICSSIMPGLRLGSSINRQLFKQLLGTSWTDL